MCTFKTVMDKGENEDGLSEEENIVAYLGNFSGYVVQRPN